MQQQFANTARIRRLRIGVTNAEGQREEITYRAESVTAPLVLDLPEPTAESAGPIRGRGIVPGNPTRCLVCGKQIGERDAWIKQTAARDPESAPAYSIIIHAGCARRSSHKQN